MFIIDFDKLIFTKNKKVKILESIINNYYTEKDKDIYFINDKPQETKEIIKSFPHLRPIMKYCSIFLKEDYQKIGYPYFNTLTEIKNYVIKQLG